MKGPSTYDLSHFLLKVDILYARPQTPPLISPIEWFQSSLVATLVKSSDSLADPPFPSFSLPSNFNCPEKVTVGPQNTKSQFIINVTEEGLQEALGRLIWEAVTGSVWSSCLCQTRRVCVDAHVCNLSEQWEISLPLHRANLCLHHSDHLHGAPLLQTVQECGQQVSFKSAARANDETKRGRGSCYFSRWQWWLIEEPVDERWDQNSYHTRCEARGRACKNMKQWNPPTWVKGCTES